MWRAIFAALFLAGSARAQFTNALLQNNNYWADGKAEFNIYAAEIMRDGALRPCEAIHIFVREQKDPAAPATLKMNQIFQAPTGLFFFQRMLSLTWSVELGQLLQWNLTQADSSTNLYKEGQGAGENRYLNDELPWLVRTIDFSKPSGAFEIQLAPSVEAESKPAKISYTSNPRLLEVQVEHAAGTDHFSLDRDGPHLLREWRAADGSHLKLKRNLKVDYWNYGKPGDRERALNNPMLRLPD